MGIYIKNMEMPKDGCHHIICIYADGMVSTGERVYMAVPVPPHGRLIDADALLNLLNHCMFPSDMVTTTALSMATNWIKEAPTIIEADVPDTNVGNIKECE